MRPTDQLLISIVSGEAAVIVGLVGWSLRSMSSQLKANATAINSLAAALERHLAWHDGAAHHPQGACSTS